MVTCSTELSSEYDVVWPGRKLPTIRRSVLPPSLKCKKPQSCKISPFRKANNCLTSRKRAPNFQGLQMRSTIFTLTHTIPTTYATLAF